MIQFIPIKIEILYPEIFPNWNEYIKRYCSEGGIIEASPTSNLITVGKPTFSFLIEPDGNIEYICSYDRINHNIFTNIAAISPQTTIKKIVILNKLKDHLDLVGRIGSNLYKNGIIGYCSAEFLTFTDKNVKIILFRIKKYYGGWTSIMATVTISLLFYSVTLSEIELFLHLHLNTQIILLIIYQIKIVKKL